MIAITKPLLRVTFYCKYCCSLLLFSFAVFTGQAQPEGFIDQEYLTGWNQAVGMTFDSNGRMFVWEKGGKVYIVENGIKSLEPFIDISEEVGNWRDFGLLGFALDPDFLSNGYIYLMYTVDRHHLLYYGTPAYDSESNEYFAATIGRITRYTAEIATNFTTVDYDSRLILLGATKESGIPSLHESHGVGSLVFGSDGSLLASTGDGASYTSIDEGSASETYYLQALSDGIISQEENVGAYRVQMLNSLNGKVLRLDPSTGLGLPSNPYYDINNPESAASKVWSLGLRNPYRMTKRPETGDHEMESGNPGVFYLGDVGWEQREEMNVVTGPGLNFGWPKFEGLDYEPGYNNSTYLPNSHALAAVEWNRRKSEPYGTRNGIIFKVGSSEIPGPVFKGNCSTGGVWYTGNDFPSDYKNTYFHADYGAHWIQNFKFDENDEVTEVRRFDQENGSVVFLATNPLEGGLYYIRYGNAIHKISYQPSGNQPPKAVISADRYYGDGPLTINFTGDQSTDPENKLLTYEWDFGNGPESTEANPTHIFPSSNGSPITYSVRLTVKDEQGLIDETTVLISVDNTPPVIESTSLTNIDQYSISGQTVLALSASVTDNEHSMQDLSYEWQTSLYHENHDHPEVVDNNPITTTTISPIGCDGVLYFYKITLKVTDKAGLSAYYEKDLYPNCGGPIARNDIGEFPGFEGSTVIEVLANDSDNLDPGTVEVVGAPSFGTAVVDASGKITYTRIKSGNSDSFGYTVRDSEGNLSNVAGVFLNQQGAPSLAILSPGEGIKIGGSDLLVRYELSGSWQSENVDGLLVSVDEETPYEVVGTSGKLYLSDLGNGAHTINLQLSTNGQGLKNTEATDQVAFEKIPSGGGNGLQARYFNNPELADPSILVRQDPAIDFDWGVSSPDVSINTDQYSVVWQGFIEALYDEQYTFYTSTDDGVRLFINEELLIDQWIDQAVTEYSATIALQAGQKYPIRMEYYENGGDATAKLSWSSDSQQKGTIPMDFLFTPNNDQSITFDAIEDKFTTDDPFQLVASSSSGLPVSFRVISGPASITGNVVALDGIPGMVLVRASQSGNEEFIAALDKDQSFEVSVLVGLEEPEPSDNRFNIYPNPATNGVNLVFQIVQNEPVQIELLDMLGRTVVSDKRMIEGGKSIVPVDLNRLGLHSGLYFVRISSKQIRQKVKRLTIIK